MPLKAKSGLLAGMRKRPLSLIALILINVGLVLALAPQLVLAERPFFNEAKARYPQLAGSSLDDCRLCHKNREGGGPRNIFGQEFQIYGYDFAVLENRDSDGDGFTNLEELTSLTIPSNPKNFPKVGAKTKPAPVTPSHITRCYLDGRGSENVPVEPDSLPVFGPEMNQVSLFELWQTPDHHATGEIKGDAARGQKLFQADLIGSDNAIGCKVCHLTNATEETVGPPLSDLGRRSAETIQRPDYTGQAKTVEAYLQESLITPGAYIVSGFTPGLMPNTYGTNLTRQEIADLIAFMLTFP